MNRLEIKARAKEFAFNNKWLIWKPYLIIMLASFVFGFVVALLGVNSESTLYSILNFAFEMAILPLSFGYTYYVIKAVRGENVDLKEALLSKYSIFGVIIIASILVGLFTTLWTLLLIIPGIIYALKMSMVSYLLAEYGDNKTKAMDVLKTSAEMMDGYKMDYFVFGLSFIGWMLLSVVTLGIALIWVYPYITVAEVMYYEELKKQKNVDKIITKE